MKTTLFIALGLVALVLVAPVSAQPSPVATVQIPFPFVIGNKVLPEGDYRIVEFDDLRLQVENVANPGVSEFVPILTRLAAREDNTSTAIVFDKTDRGSALSEVWIAGFDGYLIKVTPEKHQHQVVRAR